MTRDAVSGRGSAEGRRMTDTIDLARLLPGTRAATLREQPCPFGWIDDYLPAELYARLAESFVAPDDHPGLNVLGRGKKRVVFTMPPVPEGLGRLDPSWRALLEALSSRAFLAHGLDWARCLAPPESVPEGDDRDLLRLRHALRPEDVELYCEFSSMEAGVLLPPHSDATDKILVFVHYFAPPGWRADWGGATEIYRPKDPAKAANWSNFFLPHDQVDLVERSAYLPNRLFFFAKTPQAWHGVSPLAPETALPRRSFNFSLRLRPEAAADPALLDLQARIRAREHAAFAA